METVLVITPHLSSGGLPQYILKTIESVKDTFDVFVVEYSFISPDYIVQRNRIIDLVRPDHFFSLRENKFEILDIIQKVRPTTIYMTEIPEMFMDFELTKKIYLKENRRYRIIETTHDSGFNPKDKLFLPDKFVFVCPFSNVKYANLGVESEVIEYPINPIENDQNQAIAALDVPGDVKHVVTVGLFTPRKNQGYVIDVARHLVNLSILFHFVGNTAPNFQQYWEPILKNKPANCIVWGERSDVPNFLSIADAIFFASKGRIGDMELNPLVIKESLEYQKPLLMFDLPVYLGRYANHKLIKFLSGNLKLDAEQLLSILDMQPNQISIQSAGLPIFELSHTLAENKININDPRGFGKEVDVSVRDIDSDLPIFFTRLDFSKCGSWFIIPIPKNSFDFENRSFNGFVLEFFYNGVSIEKQELRIRNTPPKITKKYHADLKDSPFINSFEFFHSDIYRDFPFETFKTVIDVGANIGLFSNYCKEKGVKTVLSIEPDPKAFHALEQNAFDGQIRENCALMGKRGTVKLFSAEMNSTITTCIQKDWLKDFGPVKEIQVEAETLSNLLAKHKIDHIDLLKLDVEGAEYNIIENLEPETFGRIDNLLIEFHENKNGELDKLLARLKVFGFVYNLFKQSSNTKIDSPIEHGWLFASREINIWFQDNKIHFQSPIEQTYTISVLDWSSLIPIYWVDNFKIGPGFISFIDPLNIIDWQNEPGFIGFSIQFFDKKMERTFSRDLLLKEGKQQPILKIVNPFDCNYLNFRDFYRQNAYKDIEVKGTVVDIGANIGLFSTWVSDRAERIVALEPHPKAFKLLTANCFNPKTITAEIALSGKNGKRTLYCDPRNSTSSSFNQDEIRLKSLKEGIEVETISFSEMCRRFELEKIDLLKVDIEGHEYEVFNSIDSTDLQKIEQLILEFHVNKGQLKEVISKLKDGGFDIQIQKQAGQDIIDDSAEEGIIIAKRRKVTKTFPAKAFVTFTNSNYVKLAEKLIESIRNVSDLPVILFEVNCQTNFEFPNLIKIPTDVDIQTPEMHKVPDFVSQWERMKDTVKLPEDNIGTVDRRNTEAFRTLSYKFKVIMDLLDGGLEEGVFLDADGIANTNIEELFSYCKEIDNYPLATKHVHEYLLWDGRGDPRKNDALEKPLMELCKVSARSCYLVSTNCFIFNQKTRPFFEECWKIAQYPEILKEPGIYAPFQDETIFNVVLWKIGATKMLPISFYNLLDHYNLLRFQTERGTNRYLNSEWQYMPESKEQVKFFHGCKDVKELAKIVSHLKQKPKENCLQYKIKNAKIAILTSYDANLDDLAGISLRNKKEYAAKHGYDLIVYDTSYFETSPQWNKIYFVLLHLEDYEWVYWIDIDTIIMDADRPLEFFLDSNSNFVFCNDSFGFLNTGAFFVRNSSDVFECLAKSLEYVKAAQKFPHEQGVLADLIQNRSEWKAKTKILPQKEFNAYWWLSNPEVLKTYPNFNRDFHIYQPGDFLVHFPGYKYEDRKMLMKDFYGRINKFPKFDLKYHFNLGAYVELIGTSVGRYTLKFIDQDTNTTIYSAEILPGMWHKTTPWFFINYKIILEKNSKVVWEHKFNAKNRLVVINVDTNSIGDTIAWMPYVEEFQKKHQCRVTCRTNFNQLLIESYPNIKFVEWNETTEEPYATYALGFWFDRNKKDWRTIPIQQVATDMLGLPFTEKRAKLKFEKENPNPNQKFVCIGPESTTKAKFWNNPNGWQDTVNFLVGKGYKVYSITKTPITLEGCENIHSKELIDIVGYIKHCEFFIGLSSGLTWLAWALGKKTIMISGFTAIYNEFQIDNYRVINEKVCNNCWNWSGSGYDRALKDWCPKFDENRPSTDKPKERHECSKAISFEMVKEKFKQLERDLYANRTN